MSSPLPLRTPPVPDPLVGQNVGGYIVEEQLGEGAMGLVYRARHPLLNRLFAIKVLRPEVAADTACSNNFVREAQTLSSLKHPSIIDIVGFGPLPDGRQYIVMEYLLGGTLERELADKGRMSSERALKLADEILDALSAAHSVDVIHRDLKPSNVFLAQVSGGRVVVKLLDFGLAKQQPEAIVGESIVAAAGASVIAGTPEYIAPEQALGRPASRQSDLYSFGVVLFEMLTGALPFQADGDSGGSQRIRGLLLKHVHQPAPGIHESAGDEQFPEGLAEIVADLLKKTPGERPSSAETVRKRLQKAYRTLQQQATQLRPNPLLADEPVPVVVAKVHLPTERVLRVSQTEKAIQPPAGEQKSRAPLLGGALAIGLLFLGGFWWWSSRSQPVVELLAKVPTPAGPPKEAAMPIAAVPTPSPPEPAPEPLQAPGVEPAADPDLENLPAMKHRPRAVVHVELARRWLVMAPGCKPDKRWRDEATQTVRELGELAAARPLKWKEYQRREAALSRAINSASEQLECGRTSQLIGELTDAVLKD